MILTKMKETAEAYLGHGVTHAIVTVPACKLLVIYLEYQPLTMTCQRLQ